MILPVLLAIKFLEPCFDRTEEPAETGDSSWLSVDLRPGDHEKIFRRELDELLGIEPTEELPTISATSWPTKGLFVEKISRGATRLQLRLLEHSGWLALVPDELLEDAIAEGRLDFLYRYFGGKTYYFMGEAAVLYTFEKTRRFCTPFQGEWFGKSTSSHFHQVLAAVRDAGRRLDRGIVKWSNFEEREELLKPFDRAFSDPAEKAVREQVEAAGIRWQQWCRSGCGFRARMGLETLFY